MWLKIVCSVFWDSKTDFIDSFFIRHWSIDSNRHFHEEISIPIYMKWRVNDDFNLNVLDEEFFQNISSFECRKEGE